MRPRRPSSGPNSGSDKGLMIETKYNKNQISKIILNLTIYCTEVASAARRSFGGL